MHNRKTGEPKTYKGGKLIKIKGTSREDKLGNKRNKKR